MKEVYQKLKNNLKAERTTSDFGTGAFVHYKQPGKTKSYNKLFSVLLLKGRVETTELNPHVYTSAGSLFLSRVSRRENGGMTVEYDLISNDTDELLGYLIFKAGKDNLREGLLSWDFQPIDNNETVEQTNYRKAMRNVEQVREDFGLLEENSLGEYEQEFNEIVGHEKSILYPSAQRQKEIAGNTAYHMRHSVANKNKKLTGRSGTLMSVLSIE